MEPEVGGATPPYPSHPSGGAEGGDAGDKSAVDMHREKFAAWSKAWRDRGYSDEEIPKVPGSQPLPPYKTPRPVARPPQQSKRKKKSKSCVPSKNAVDELSRYEMEAEQKEKMEQIGREGELLMQCVKFCVEKSYALEEVALAYSKCGDTKNEDKVLSYLKEKWAVSIREVQTCVLDMLDAEGRSVGCPTELEARKHLVLSRGDVISASEKVYNFRRKKIEELQLKLRPQCELDWESALLALAAFDMDVERAACSVQCEALQPLYEFIFSDWKDVQATDMKNIKKRLKHSKEEEAREANLRMLMGEFKLPTVAKATMALELMNKVEVEGEDEEADYPLSYYTDAAKDYATLEDAERGLIKECPICTLERPVHEMITMPGCTDALCKDCFKGHFRVIISEQGVKHFNCPMCKEPDMTNRDDAADLYQELFVHLIHEHVPEKYDMVQTKLAERNLQKDPGFRWCANDKCGNCFINPNPERKKIQCPICSELMCFQCKKPWEDQHNGLSCDEFAEWKRQNDPKFQKEGLAAHLQANGIGRACSE
jgi:E3 ubiquitin-protein ligase RNF31